MRRKTTYVALSLLVSCLVLLGSAKRMNAQVLYGSIVGTVTDQTGAVIPGASLTITNTETNQVRNRETDTAGYYSIPNLLAGRYDLKVEISDFQTYTQTGIVISINKITRVNVNMQVGAVTETVTVEASVAILQTESSDVKTALESEAMENLPLSNYRNYQSLINLVPGATPGRFQNAVTDTPERALSHNVNGQDRGANNQRLDGSANILVTLPHHAAYIAPVESIQEVNVSTNNFEAEQGITGGAAVTVVTKSGTNEFHGSAFYMHDSSAVRAFTWDENRAGLTDKPTDIRNIGGGNIGGPIKKDKLFFFFNWEGLFDRLNRTRRFSVPAADLRTGDFTRIFGDTTPVIFDPYTGNLDGTGRTPFSDGGRFNVIPAARLNGPMMQLMGLVPLPNQPGDVDNFFTSGIQSLNRNNIDAKVNWNRSVKHQLWFKYSNMNALAGGDFGLGAAGGPCVCDGGIGRGSTFTQIAGIGQTYTVSPTFVIDATLGWTRFGQVVEAPDLGVNFGLDVLGIPGTNGPDLRESGMPEFSISGFTSLGNPEGWSPTFRNDQSYTFNTNASMMKGAHEIRFGFDFLHHLMNHWQPELGAGPRGAFGFGRDVTTDGSGDGTDFHALASFLIGAPQNSGKSSQFIKMDSLENVFALYVRDRWHVTPKLTLNLGVRWELFPNRRRSNGLGFEAYDVDTNEALIGGRGGLPRNLGVGWSKKLFAPRIGLAYRVTDSTVVRTGYGITYHAHPWGAQAMRGFFPLTVVGEFEGENGFQPVTTDPNYLAAGVPNQPLGPTVGIVPICCPDISAGRIPIPSSALMGFMAPDKQLDRGYIQSWNFIIEQKLPGELVTSIGYVGSASVKGFAFDQLNVSQTPGSGNAGRPLFAKFGRTGGTWIWNGSTNNNYHSLQATINRRLKGGLLLKGAYTYSRTINTVDYSDWTRPRFFPAPNDIHRQRAPAGYNIPHIFQLGYVYELPLGEGKKLANSGAARTILGGWQINGIFSSYQGRQYTLRASGSSLNMRGSRQTPDQVKDTVEKLGNVGDDGTFFDITAFAPVTDVRFGTVGRNTMRGPGRVNMDLSLFRTFTLTEKVSMQFRAEMFNLSNTPHFNNPNANVNSSNFGRITSTTGGGSGDALARSRGIRFGLRLDF